MGYSRQYFYKHCKEQQVKNIRNRDILAMVHAERKVLPMLGGRKIYYQIKPLIVREAIKIGRDKLFSLLKANDLLIRPKRRYVTTTNSKHWLRKYPNIIKGLQINRPEQVWVSDITYIKTDEGNCYLNLVTDAYSRRIMGYAIAKSMSTEEMKKAYDQAVQSRKYKGQPLIHHSDRGLQYCSGDYIKVSTDNEIGISMTENGDPYENALAERMNKTLKEEFGLGMTLVSRKQAYKLAEEAIFLYNTRRPHLALKLKTPDMVHLQKIPTTGAVGII